MNTEHYEFINQISQLIENTYTNVSKEVATFIACQFALESKYGTSNLAVYHCNFSGMKYAYVRPRTSTPIQGSEFACYVGLVDCVTDYFLALAFHRVESWDMANIQRFSFAIKKWYCHERDYINNITTIYQQFKSFQNEK